MVLLVIPIYAIALVLRETVGESDLQYEEYHLHYIKPFMTLSNSFFTVFRCIMGDCSTATGQPIPVLLTDNFGWAFAVGFAVVISVTTFGLFNVIIALYVDNIQQAQKNSHDKALQHRLMNHDRYLTIMGDIVDILGEEILDRRDASEPPVEWDHIVENA